MDTVEQFKRAMNVLTPREKEIIKLRVFNGETLEEIGKELHVTRERIRQIEAKSLEIFKKTYLHFINQE